MAHGSAPAEDKTPAEITADHDVATREEGPQLVQTEYDIERIEAVYRKLDLRIIPGKCLKWLDNRAYAKY